MDVLHELLLGKGLLSHRRMDVTSIIVSEFHLARLELLDHLLDVVRHRAGLG